MKDFSVIIRNKNESRWIGHAIQSALDYFHSPELIVINNKSNDESMEIVRGFRHDPNLEPSIKQYCELKTIDIDEYTPGKALNLGVSLSTNKYICIMSAHTVIRDFNSSYIEKKIIDFPCIFGHQKPIYRGKRITPRYLWSHFSDEDIVNMYSELENRYFLHNAFAIYHRDILIKSPFDEQICGKEDRLWAASLVKSGKNYLYTPQIKADHHYTVAGNTWKGVG